jgi:hypothetical protein
MALIDAWRRDTGEQVLIPDRWVGNKRLAAPFTLTPPGRAKPAPAPTVALPDGEPTPKEK